MPDQLERGGADARSTGRPGGNKPSSDGGRLGSLHNHACRILAANRLALIPAFEPTTCADCQ